LLVAIAAIAAALHLLASPYSTASRSSTAPAAPRHLFNGEDRSVLLDDKARSYLSTDGWPGIGQGAYVLGNGRPVVSPHEQPVPIASVAKVMTAYVVLKHDPLRAGDSGRRFVVAQGDVVDTETRRRGASRLSLSALASSSPSGNVSVLVARQVSGSVASFVAEMNRTAYALGMSHTTYTDPSGYDPGTVSTALDRLRLAQVVAKDQAVAALMATRSYWLPVAGEVTNTNTLLGQDGFVGMKTGSDQAAGGCLMFRAVWPARSGSRSVIGVVLGQRGDNLLAAGLSAARQLVDRLATNGGAGSSSSSGSAGRPSPGQPGLGTPPGVYRRHIENHIRAGNTPLS
jgi:D-alanyl-D-alanine carboxypeptidase (penicillin-binding protein 5/6)